MSLVNYAHNPQLEGTQLQRADDPNSYLNMDYEMHLGTKIDYLFFQSSRLLQATEIQLLQNQCEQERTQILTNLMLALEKPRLAGYMLTGNRSMFLETDGSLAWLYHCPKVHSPLHTMNQCYDKIPILYEGEIRFVDPIRRQTYPDAAPQNCSDRIKTLFQLNMDQEDSWYTLTPGIVHQDRPAIFGPKKITPMSAQSLTGSQDAGMYTRNELRGFWDNILINAASRTALKKFSPKPDYLLYFSGRIWWIRLLHSKNWILCGQNDIPGIFQRPVHGHVWTSRIFPRALRNLLFCVFIFQTYNRCCGYGNTPLRNLSNDRRLSRVR